MWFGVGKEAAMLLKIRQYVVIKFRFFIVGGIMLLALLSEAFPAIK
jgi:hypothetical protein